MSGLLKMAVHKIFDTLSLNGAPALCNSVFQHSGMKSSIKSVVLQLMNQSYIIKKIFCISCI